VSLKKTQVKQLIGPSHPAVQEQDIKTAGFPQRRQLENERLATQVLRCRPLISDSGAKILMGINRITFRNHESTDIPQSDHQNLHISNIFFVLSRGKKGLPKGRAKLVLLDDEKLKDTN